MSYVFADPEFVAAAASDLASIGSSIDAASSAAAAPTGSVAAAGADEVSAIIAALFGAHAQAYQSLSQQASQFHQQFVQLMNVGANKYATAEAANELPMQTAAAAISAPMQALAGIAPGSSSGAASAAAVNSEERVLATRKDGALVQVGVGSHGGASGLGSHGVGSASAVMPASPVIPGWASGGSGSGVLLGNAAALTSTSVLAAGDGGGSNFGGPSASLGDGRPAVGGVLSGQTPAGAAPTVDRAAAPAGRNESHAESAAHTGQHAVACESVEEPAHALDVTGAAPAHEGLRGGGGSLYGGGNGGFYSALTDSDAATKLLAHGAPGLAT